MSRPDSPPPPPAPKGERPRDEFGRPLPWGSVNRLELPEFEALSLEENHRLALEYLQAGTYFGAHEAWENAWRLARETPDQQFFQGLSQLGAGYTHAQRGNPRGARTLLERAVGRLRAYPSPHRGIDVAALIATLDGDIARLEGLERHDPVPPLAPPRRVAA